MAEAEYTQLIKTTIFNIINNHIEQKYNVKLLENEDDVKKMMTLLGEEELNKSLIERLLEKGVSLENVQKIEQVIPGLKESIEITIQYFDDSFESLHDAICSINYQLHSDKIAVAVDDKMRFDKRVNSKDINEVKALRDKIEDHISSLKSDMTTRIDKCKSINKNKKKMLFGLRKVKEIRSALSELQETFPIYINTILLLAKIELFLGETENSKITLETAITDIRRLFPFDNPLENRMYTLTDDSYWIEKPKEYSNALEYSLNQINQLRTKFLILNN